MPPYSPATGLPNLIYNWRDYNIRYQVSGPNDANHVLLLVHGLFVNSDHWRKALTGLQQQQQQTGTLGADDTSGTTKQKTCRIYALDLLGSGWSSKPSRLDPQAMSVDGENGRFIDCDSICYRDNRQQASKGGGSSRRLQKKRSASTLQNVPLGTSAGGNRMASSLELRHPLRSPYNFYTWAEQLADFTRDVIHADILHNSDDCKKVTLISNSIGTMSSLQSIIDEPYLYNGIFIINPNFRELHMAEVPFSPITMPLVRTLQSTLRENGHGLFKTLATPSTVKTILKEPYSVVDAIDDELVSVLLQPLLTEGADDVVFDTLSDSAGPLPEQQLRSKNFPVSEVCPVWVAYGKDDPWTPAKRVEALGRMIVQRSRLDESGKVVDTDVDEMAVERVIGLVGAGHCPHDEVPEKVNELILEFLDRLEQ
jgi:pimeloyl-ACP methyl ester carboxylesterase